MFLVSGAVSNVLIHRCLFVRDVTCHVADIYRLKDVTKIIMEIVRDKNGEITQ